MVDPELWRALDIIFGYTNTKEAILQENVIHKTHPMWHLLLSVFHNRWNRSKGLKEGVKFLVIFPWIKRHGF